MRSSRCNTAICGSRVKTIPNLWPQQYFSDLQGIWVIGLMVGSLTSRVSAGKAMEKSDLRPPAITQILITYLIWYLNGERGAHIYWWVTSTEIVLWREMIINTYFLCFWTHRCLCVWWGRGVHLLRWEVCQLKGWTNIFFGWKYFVVYIGITEFQAP